MMSFKIVGILIAEYVEEVDLVYYGFTILKRAIAGLNLAGSFKKPASNCNEHGLEWDQGRKVYEYITFVKANLTIKLKYINLN